MSTTTKTLIVIFCLICSLIGFLIKIPVPLRGNDKLLHSGFYFCAAAFLHFLFRKRFIVIILGLALFGVLIEYLQQLANQFTHSHIHGRFDKEDIYANLKGLAAYSAIALLIRLFRKSFKNSPGKTS